MSMKTKVSSAISWLLGSDLDEITSERLVARRAMRVAQRFSRGNTNVQNGRLVTEEEQIERIDAYVSKVKRKEFFFQR
jgi:hypothetical protein